MRFLISLIFLGISLCAQAAPEAKTQPIKIGVAAPLTGAYSAFGAQLWEGAEQAAKDINARGGINGQPIELIRADDMCQPEHAVTVANRLVTQNKVKAVIGHFCSSSTIPASAVYAHANLLMMTPASTNPAVTEQGFPTVFRLCGRDDQQGAVAARFIVNRLKAKRIVVIDDQDTYGRGIAQAMKQELHKLGMQEVFSASIKRGEKDFQTLVNKIKAAKADVVYFGGLHPEAGALVHELRQQASKTAFVAGDGVMSLEFLESAGGPEFAEGVYMTFGADPRMLPSAQGVVKTFREADIEPEGYTLYAYAALQAVAAAMTAIHSQTGTELAQWLHAHTVPTVLGDKAWNVKGDLKQSDYVMYQWNKDGHYVMVKP